MLKVLNNWMWENAKKQTGEEKADAKKLIKGETFQEHLIAAKEAVEAFKVSEKSPRDLADFFIVTNTSIKSCYEGPDRGMYVRDAMEKQILEFIQPGR